MVLPNAWDAASAKIFAQEEFRAIGTTSAGVAAALGYRDGEEVPWPAMIEAIRRIVQAVRLPVTADCEGGYQGQVSVRDLITDLVKAGAVGPNIEDGCGPGAAPLRPVAAQCQYLEAIREEAGRQGQPLVLNARTDAFWHPVGDTGECLASAVKRGQAYRKAGADCIFVPGVEDRNTIARLVDGISAPVNILIGPGSPSVAELQALGVARVSVGSGIFRAALASVQRRGRDLRESGTYGGPEAEGLDYSALQSLYGIPLVPPD